MEDRKIEIRLESQKLLYPITVKVVDEALKLLNLVFNLSEFKDELSTQTFFCSNRPDFCKNSNYILGKDVYDDFIGKELILVNLTVKKLLNPWKRIFSKTYGATDINSNLITTYTWWLNSSDNKELIIEYASHIGHEIFHTKYFKYIHDPESGSKYFENDKDVTYKIDEIIEKLIISHYR